MERSEERANGRIVRLRSAGYLSAGAGYTFTDDANGHTGEALRAFATEAVHSNRKPQHTDNAERQAGKALEQHVMYLRRELKVCEGCGGLWVRTGVEAGVYCRTCSALVADLPGRRRRSPGRPCKIHNAGGTRLQVVAAAATGEQLREPRGRCTRRSDAEEQQMEETAAERRAGMALVALPASTEAAPVDGSAVGADGVPCAIGGVMASGADAVMMMRKPAGSVVLVEQTVALAMVGGVR